MNFHIKIVHLPVTKTKANFSNQKTIMTHFNLLTFAFILKIKAVLGRSAESQVYSTEIPSHLLKKIPA